MYKVLSLSLDTYVQMIASQLRYLVVAAAIVITMVLAEQITMLYSLRASFTKSLKIVFVHCCGNVRILDTHYLNSF